MSDESKPEKKQIHPIDIDFFTKKGNKTTKLVNNQRPEFSIDGQHRWYKYEFIEPVYLTKISIKAEGYSTWDKFEVEVEHIDGTKHEEQVPVSGTEVNLALGKLSRSFSFRPAAKWLASPKLTGVMVHGLTLVEFHDYEWTIKSIEEREKKVAASESRLNEIEERRKELKAESSSLETEVGKSRAELEELRKSVTTAQELLSDLTQKTTDMQQQVDGLRVNKRELEGEISAQGRKLQELTREVRLFPSEITGFVKEGNRNIKWYIALSAPFTAILCVILYSIFSGAIDLTQLWRKENDIEIWTIFLTRLPFVLVALALIETCGYIVGRLIYEIVRINRQRLEFAKISIIAKDVSAASALDTDLSDQEVFDRETSLKMEMLREHMKSYSGSDFQYKGSALVSALVGVANKLTGGSKKGESEGT